MSAAFVYGNLQIVGAQIRAEHKRGPDLCFLAGIDKILRHFFFSKHGAAGRRERQHDARGMNKIANAFFHNLFSL